MAFSFFEDDGSLFRMNNLLRVYDHVAVMEKQKNTPKMIVPRPERRGTIVVLAVIRDEAV